MNHELRIMEKLKHKLSTIRYTLCPSKGFTLIELLIVIVIIGVLSAMLMANFVGVRQRARDAQRKSDLRQIQSALELYRSDVGNYPAANGSMLSTAGCPTSSSLSYGGTVYMNKIPCDPVLNPYDNPGYAGEYQYTGIGSPATGYKIYACLENQNDSDPNVVAYNSSTNPNLCKSQGKSYNLTNP